MQIKNLSKAEYCKARNIVPLRPATKLTPQPSLSIHILQEVPPQTSQILNFLKNKKNQQNRELNFMGYQQSLHELQFRVQDLKKILSNKEDQIMELRNEKENNTKRINFLENDVFNLRAQISKLEYEYKSTIGFLISEHEGQKRQYENRISFLEQELRVNKIFYEKQTNEIRDSYEIRIKTGTGESDIRRNMSEHMINSLRKQIEGYLIEINRLKNQLFLHQKDKFQQVRHIEEENERLTKEYTSLEYEFNLSVTKFREQINSKSQEITQLKDLLQKQKVMFDFEIGKYQSQKQEREKEKEKIQTQVQNQINQISSEKKQLEIQLTRKIQQKSELKNQNILLERQLQEQRAKVSSLEQQIRINIREIDQLKQTYQKQRQREIVIQKRNNNQQCLLLQNDLTEKNQIISTKQEENQNLRKELNALIQQIQINEDKIKACAQQKYQLQQKVQQHMKQIRELRGEKRVLIMQYDSEKEKIRKEIQEKNALTLVDFEGQLNKRMQNQRKDQEQIIKKFQAQIAQNKKQIEKYQENISKTNRQKQQLSAEKNFWHHKFQLLNKAFESQREVFNARLLQQMNEGIEKNKKEIDKQETIIKEEEKKTNEIQIPKQEKKGKNSQKNIQFNMMEQLRKEANIWASKYDKLRIQSQSKYMEAQQRYQQKLKSIAQAIKRQGQLRFSREKEDLLEKIQEMKQTIEKNEKNQKVLQNLINTGQAQLARNQRLIKQRQGILRQNQVLKTRVMESQKLTQRELKQRTKVEQDKLEEYMKARNQDLVQRNQRLIKENTEFRKKISTLEDLERQRLLHKQCKQKVHNLKIKMDEKLLEKDQQIYNLNQEIKRINNQYIKTNLVQKFLEDECVSVYEPSDSSQSGHEDRMYRTQVDKDSKHFKQDLKSKINYLKTKIEQLQLDLDYANQGKKQFQLLFTDRQNQILKLKEKIHQLTQEKGNQDQNNNVDDISRLKIKQIREQDVSRLRETVNAYETTFKLKEIKINVLQHQSRKNEQTIKMYERKIEGLQRTVSEDFVEKQKFEAKYKDYKEKYENYKQFLKNANEEHGIQKSKDKQEIRKLQREISNIQEQLQIVNEKNLNLNNKIQDLQKQYQNKSVKYMEDVCNYLKQIESLKSKLNSAEITHEQMRMEFRKETEQCIQSLKAKHQNELNQIMSKHHKIFDQNIQQIKAHEAKIVKLRKNIQTLIIYLQILMEKFYEEKTYAQDKYAQVRLANRGLQKYRRKWNRICGDVKLLDKDQFDLQSDCQSRCSQSVKFEEIQAQFFPQKVEFKQTEGFWGNHAEIVAFVKQQDENPSISLPSILLEQYKDKLQKIESDDKMKKSIMFTTVKGYEEQMKKAEKIVYETKTPKGSAQEESEDKTKKKTYEQTKQFTFQ